MIIYGWRSTQSELTPVPGTPCKSCGQASLFSFTEYRYAHVYWIPFFPLGRDPGTVCGSCKTVVTGAAVVPPAAATLAPLRLRYFAGLAVTMAIMIAVGISSTLSGVASASYAFRPAVGDVYVVKVRPPQKPGMDYDAWRVIAVRDADVDVLVSAFSFRHARSVEEALTGVLADERGWEPHVKTVPRAEVPANLADGRIESILRP